jgi:hypothetical protein
MKYIRIARELTEEEILAFEVSDEEITSAHATTSPWIKGNASIAFIIGPGVATDVGDGGGAAIS